MDMNIENMYTEVKEIAEQSEHSVHISASETKSGIQIGGDKSIPQIIEVEFEPAVSEDIEKDFLYLTQGTTWEFVDEDGIFQENKDVDENGSITVSRDVDPSSVSPLNKFEKSVRL